MAAVLSAQEIGTKQFELAGKTFHEDEEPGGEVEHDIEDREQGLFSESFETGREECGDCIKDIVARDQVHETHADRRDFGVV